MLKVMALAGRVAGILHLSETIHQCGKRVYCGMNLSGVVRWVGIEFRTQTATVDGFILTDC
jgi:hypothetical protein